MKNKIFNYPFLLIVLLLYDYNYCCGQWILTNGSIQTGLSLTSNGAYIFAGSWFNGVYRSSNNGDSWTQTSLNALDIFALTASGGNIIAGTDTCIFLSNDNGQIWKYIDFNSGTVRSLAISGTNVYARDDGGVDRSTNSGMNWIFSTYYINGRVVAAYGQYVFVGDQNTNVSRSTNSGQNWSQTSLHQTYYIGAIAINGTTIFVGTGGNGIYRSTNNGQNWAQTTLNNKIINALAVSGNNIIAGADYTGVYVSNDNGQIWTLRNEGLSNIPGLQFCSFLIANNYIFAGAGNSVYRRPLSQIIGIKEISSEVPDKYSLSQNYPNPFNSMTKVKWSMLKASNAKITVYDMRGREVEILINEKQSAGTYETVWDASLYPSGVYFYRLVAGATDGTGRVFTETKRMILIK